jgi:hypothetical protein
MKQIVFAGVVLGVMAQAAHAATLSIKVENKAAVALNSISAVSMLSGTAASTTLSAALATNAKGTLSLVQTGTGGTDCVYDLTFTFAGKITKLPAFDLCQTDAIIAE